LTSAEIAQRTRGRRVMLTVLAICAAPFVLATIAFYVWTPPRSTNYGELLPLQQPKFAAMRADGKPLDLATFQPNWVLVSIDNAPCDDACKKKLFLTRQVRIAQGRDQDRVTRLWLVQGDAPLDPSSSAIVDNAIVARPASSEDLARVFGPNRTSHVFLIDPLGNLMMRFPADPDPKGVMKDLSKLLRVNNRGS
ncbi:MAG: cytochrome C oxidase subunit I, partial [Burkholderiales bacterium]